MARPYSQPHDHADDPGPGEWHALRDELVALLDQVESQVARKGREEPGYRGASRRLHDLRYQAADMPPDRRQREALRSVQRAVDRFGGRDEDRTGGPPSYPAGAQDTLQSAIQQIRSRQGVETPTRRPEPPRFDELAQAVGGISGRLERLEAELRTQARSQTGNIKEIADQVAQLSHVVELLAGAVGETGQVKRLEGQIAGLGRLIAEGPQADLVSLGRRLDQLAATVSDLTEMQHRQADTGALIGRLDDVSATVGRLADLQVQFADRVDKGPQQVELAAGMQAVEEGVRAVYDRIDALERHTALAPAELDRLTEEMARVTEALRHPQQPSGLVDLVDALNQRVADIESRHGDVGGLKADVEALRGAVVEAIEPRFAALEMQLEALADRVSEPPDISVGQLEAQVRQLVARMDQTGEQLTGLARLYSTPAEAPAPDYDAIADLVAARVPAAAGLGDDGIDEIERRVARLMEAAAGSRDDNDEYAAMRQGIGEVNERLARLEATLTARAHAAERAASPEPEPTPVSPGPAASAAKAEPRPADDNMPQSPAQEAPLTDRPFPPPDPVRAALEAKNGPRRRHPGLETATGADRPAASVQPDFDPATVERPPRPSSSLDGGTDVFAAATAPPAATEPAATPAAGEDTLPPAPSANTFIAAARRAAQRQQQQPAPPEGSPRSLIARALAGFQPGGATAGDGKPAAEEPPRPKRRRKAETNEKPPEDPNDGSAPEPETKDGSTAATEQESFLTRHRRPILLAASAVALTFLTLNLIGQRLAQEETPPPAAPAASGEVSGDSVGVGPAASAVADPATARVIPMVDTLATASIDPAAALGFSREDDMPAMPRAFVATAATPPTETETVDPVTDDVVARTAALRSATETIAPLSDDFVPLESPVQVEMPPEGVGPEALRKAAAEGDARAQFEVAAIFTEGRAVPEDFEAAAKWYERAAAQGFAPAQYRLGSLYENGRGVEKDLTQARLWYQRAAEAGNRMSMHNLAALYAGGELGEQDFEAAARWFEQAGARGMRDSQFNLGMLYARGLGTPQDLEQSYKWFSLAALDNDADAAKARDDIAASLDAETVARLDDEVAAWTATEIDLAANYAPIGTWSDSFDPGAPIERREVVASVQSALTALGFDVGAADGLPGPRTSEAIKAFERATGMSEIGAINPRLLAVLGSQPL